MSATTFDAPASPASGAFLTTDEIARNLRRSTQTIRRFVAQDGLPVHRVNRRLYFDPAEVDAWLRDRAQVSAPPFAESDPYREHIKRLVDQAPPLTAEQADRIRAVLIEA